MSRGKNSRLRQLETSREWKKRNQDRHAELARAYRRRNPEKIRAQNLLNYAIRKGEVERGNCQGCGTSVRVHAHHHDYGKPFEVKWLCYRCHKQSHPVSDEDKRIKFSGAQKGKLFGEANPWAKLTAKQVREIRALLDAGVPQEKIGALYGVSQVHVSRIKNEATWEHLKR